MSINVIMSNNSKKEHLSYIDIYKGLLIAMVATGHVWMELLKYVPNCNLETCPFEVLGYIVTWYCPFYMAAFFWINGFCSSFTEPLKVQLQKDFKRLIIPTIFVPLIMYGVLHLLLLPTDANIGCDMAMFVSWFTISLFISRLIFKIVIELKIKAHLKISILILLMLIGGGLMRKFSILNIYGLEQGLIFPLFIYCGYVCKQWNIENKILLPLLSAYTLYIYMALRTSFLETPALCAVMTFKTVLMPVYFMLAMAGTFIVFIISRWIGHCHLLELCGKHSLLIYLTHPTFYIIFCIYGSQSIADLTNHVWGTTFVILAMISGAIIWGVIWGWLFDTKYLRWIIGKNK